MPVIENIWQDPLWCNSWKGCYIEGSSADNNPALFHALRDQVRQQSVVHQPNNCSWEWVLVQFDKAFLMILQHYIRKTTFEFSHLIASYCIFACLIANISPDKTEPTCYMSYHIKTYKKIKCFSIKWAKIKQKIPSS